MLPDPTAVLVEGPWTHREVTAGGLRTHVAETGPPDGPLVLLLHGFPEFWWAWRAQLVALGAAGLHAVAVDLRGVGGTDKPPRGYDAPTLAADVAGLVRALGARDAAVVGTDLGGGLAWTVATLHPREVRQVAVVGAAHPLQLVRGASPAQLRASGHLASFQVPQRAESRLQRDDAALVGALLQRWGGPGFPDAETEARCREAVQVPGAAHCLLEHFRWQVRSLTRPSGWQHLRRLRQGVAQPVLQLHGALDRCQLPATARGSARWARGSYRFELLEGVGHFPHEEAPEVVSDALLGFLA
ncbi:MAG: alpha/beta hydrolase fold protein [Frankiales bacterium]|nr:alpha/beta hydrolase fold protein [Frankiales bacterium]